MIPVPAQAPLFQSIFGPAWDTLPPMMQRRCSVRPFSDDRVTVEGVLDVKLSPLAQLLSPFLKIVGALVPYAGSSIPVTVSFYSTPGRRDFHFDRTFHFPDGPYRFHSRMEPLTGGEMIEFMRVGLGWRFWYGVEGRKVVLKHRGYVWRVLGRLIPLPMEWVLGRGYAEEEPISDSSFRMHFAITHRWLGYTYGYGGTFNVTE
jgi:Domain of unknown function (DUF4166)